MVHVSLLKRLEGHDWQVSSVAFHPAGDMLASASWDRTVRIWDIDAGKELRVIDRSGHTAPITSVAWHPNGALLATTSADFTTCLWDASTGSRLRTLKEHFGWVLRCSFAPDRTKLATASWDKTVRLWDPNTGELLSTLRGHTKGVWGCSFYPVGHTSALLASCGEDSTARLWDTRTKKVALTLSGGHADAIYSIAWSADGTLLATGSADKTIAIWDPKVGRILRMLQAHEDTVKDLCFTPVERNGVNMLASAGGYNSVLWNPKATMHNALSELRQHAPGKEVEAVSISYNGKLVATGSRDGKVCVSAIPDFPKDEFFDVTKQEKRNWRQTSDQPAPRPTVVAGKKKSDGQDDSAIAVRKRELERAAIPESAQSEKPKPVKTDASKLLASRGFKDGEKVTAADLSTYDSVESSGPTMAPPAAAIVMLANAAALSSNPPPPPPLPPPLPVVEKVPELPLPAPKPLPTFKEGPSEDLSRPSHPMVEQFKSASQQPQIPGVPRRATINDPSALLKAMRDRNQAAEMEAESRPVIRSSHIEAKPDIPATVESIMRDSKPVLGQRVKVRTSTYLTTFPEQP